MKSSLIIIVALVLFFGCSKDDNDSIRLAGKWVLIETLISDGGSSGNWHEVSDEGSYFIDLKEDLTFLSDRINVCDNGNYTFTNEFFTLVYSCDNVSSGNPPGTFKEIYYFENSNLIITPYYLSCDEGCLYKFKKVPLEE